MPKGLPLCNAPSAGPFLDKNCVANAVRRVSRERAPKDERLGSGRILRGLALRAKGLRMTAHRGGARYEPPMPATPDDLFAFLDRLGIAHTTVSHPPLFTVEQSQALRGTIPGAHTKNLFLKDKK